jgi:hypothetical protein
MKLGAAPFDHFANHHLSEHPQDLQMKLEPLKFRINYIWGETCPHIMFNNHLIKIENVQ